MMRLTRLLRSRPRQVRWLTALSVAGLLSLPSVAVHAQSAALKPTAPDYMLLVGLVMDSLHQRPLAKATVSIEGTNRSAITNADGEYRIDSIPPGKHRVILSDPQVDTMGLAVASAIWHRIGVDREFPFVAGETHSLDLFTPSGEMMAAALCTPMMRSTRVP